MDWHAATSLFCPACHAPVAGETAKGTSVECPHCGRELAPVYSQWRKGLRLLFDLAGGFALGWREFGWPSTFAGFVFFLFFAFPTFVLFARFASAPIFNFAFDFLFPPQGLRVKGSPIGGILGLGPGNESFGPSFQSIP